MTETSQLLQGSTDTPVQYTEIYCSAKEVNINEKTNRVLKKKRRRGGGGRPTHIFLLMVKNSKLDFI
jgi:hypothetical protein